MSCFTLTSGRASVRDGSQRSSRWGQAKLRGAPEVAIEIISDSDATERSWAQKLADRTMWQFGVGI